MNLPISFDRKFRPWRYLISHSVLKLRSIDYDSAPDFIEVTFIDVLGVKLKAEYHPLIIGIAPSAEVDEILKFSGVQESPHRDKVRCLILAADTGDGFVACTNYVIRS